MRTHDMNRRSALKRLAVASTASVGLAACSRLELFDAITPWDDGASRVASGVAYGAHPRQKLDVYAPPGAKDAPVVVFFYGGSWNSGERVDYGFLGTALAAQGFVTVLPDYRLVPEVRFPAFIEDGAAATAWVQREIGQFGGGGQRVVVSGHSAGAYIASMLAVEPSYLGQAGARERLRGFAGLAGPYDFLPLQYDAMVKAFGNWPRPVETQPVAFAKPGAPPALLLQGAADTTVPPRHAQSLAERLKAAGNEVELVIYDGVDHIDIMIALSRLARGRANTLNDISRFVRRVTA
jgi:acetyl esterase/lipase